MLDYPKTIAEAHHYQYGQRSSNPHGNNYNNERCAYEIWQGMLSCQCSRKNGYGPCGLYCKQHAKQIANRLGAFD
jgi:hypothetical protein